MSKKIGRATNASAGRKSGEESLREETVSANQEGGSGESVNMSALIGWQFRSSALAQGFMYPRLSSRDAVVYGNR